MSPHQSSILKCLDRKLYGHFPEWGLSRLRSNERVRSIDLTRSFPFKQRYRIIASTSCDTVSNVVTVFEFASNARCATIRLENSVEILTFDCSNAASSTEPRPPAPATPTLACPDAAVVVKLLLPEAVSPAVLATVATAT